MPYISRWNGSSWQSLAGGMNDYVHALLVHDGGLYAAGEFTMAGSVAANRIARWNGSTWEPVGTQGFDGTVQALAILNGQLIAGGEFLNADSPHLRSRDWRTTVGSLSTRPRTGRSTRWPSLKAN
jgi:hypothetical protein